MTPRGRRSERVANLPPSERRAGPRVRVVDGSLWLRLAGDRAAGGVPSAEALPPRRERTPQGLEVDELAELAGALGRIIRRERERQQLTQRTVARRAHLTTAEVSRVERGRRPPSLRVLVALCRGLRLGVVVVSPVVRPMGSGSARGDGNPLGSR